MAKQNKKVICVKAGADKEYEQVIFVMKDREPELKNKGRINFVLEAERIINEKLDQTSIHKAQQNAVLKRESGIAQLIIKKTSAFDIALNICMMGGCLFLSAMLLFA